MVSQVKRHARGAHLVCRRDQGQRLDQLNHLCCVTLNCDAKVIQTFTTWQGGQRKLVVGWRGRTVEP
jgi:hypothetical protein